MKHVPKKLYEAMEARSNPPMHVIEFNTFIDFAEVLCLSQDRIVHVDYKFHSKIGFLSQCFFNISGDQ